MDLKKIITGAVTTLVIGGAAYTISQTDVVNNFAETTGMSQEEAQRYIENVKESDLVSWDKLGSDLINDGNDIKLKIKQIDCDSYEYEWESTSLSCEQGKTQMDELGEREILLGQAYRTLSLDSATDNDISITITRIDGLNSAYNYPIVIKLLDQASIKETINTNSYNRATLQAALESK